MIRVQVKHDTQHRTWKQLSVSFLDACPLEKVKSDCFLYMQQYAIDNQMNYHQLSVRAVDDKGNVLYLRQSNAIVNRPKE